MATHNVQPLLFCATLLTFIVACFVDDSHFGRDDTKPQCSFDFHSLVAKDIKHFLCIYWKFFF
jgi:hypothetical protein